MRDDYRPAAGLGAVEWFGDRLPPVEPTADLLVAEMRRRRVPCVRWNLDQFPLGSTLTYRTSSDGFEIEIVTDGRRIDLQQVGSIWCRWVRALRFPPELSAPDRRFAEAEAERTLTALYTVAKVLWINHPHRHICANSKPAQLVVARKLGLEIPPTVITSDPDEVRSFIAQSKEAVIHKTLTQNLDTEPGQVIVHQHCDGEGTCQSRAYSNSRLPYFSSWCTSPTS